MSNGMIYSFILHLLVFLIVVFGLPSWNRLPQETVISVEVVPISKISNIKPKKAEKIQEKEQPEKAKIIPKSSIEEVTEQAEPKKEQQKEAKPEPKKDAEKIKDKEKKPEEKKKDDKKKDDKKEKLKDKTKPVKKKKQKKSELDSLLKTLEESSKAKEEDKENKKQQLEDELNELDSKSDKYNEEHPLSLSEEDAIRSQIQKWWSVPAGAADAGKMVITVKMHLDPDGTVTNVELLNSSSYSDKDATFFRAAADAAVRAARRASPIQNLPPEKYHRWKELELNFDPKDMLF